MSTTLFKYKIFCTTDNQYEYIWDSTIPTTCPVNGGHTVDLNRRSKEAMIEALTIASVDSPWNLGRQSVLCNTTNGNITVNLPKASRSKNGVVLIKKTASANTVTIAPNGSDQIDSSPNLTLTTLNQVAILSSDGVADWTSESHRTSINDVENQTYLPLTDTKGEIIVDLGNSQTSVTTGTDGYFLSTDSAQNHGLLWNNLLDDTIIHIANNSDNTKRARFDASSISTSTTRVLTVPDADLTLVGTTTAQTLTNKTIDANNNTITNVNHNSLTNLTTGDVHSQYAYLAGRSGGQTLTGDTASGGDLTLQSTSHATKGAVKTKGILVANDEGFATSYALSVQKNEDYAYIEILNNGGTNKGAFFGMELNDFAQYNWQGGHITFWVDTVASSGSIKYTMQNDGVFRIHDLNTGLVKADTNGRLSSATLVNADVNASAAIDATKIHDGTVSNTEFGYLNGVTSAIQTQLNAKAASSHTHVKADVTDFTEGDYVHVTGDETVAGEKTFTGNIGCSGDIRVDSTDNYLIAAGSSANIMLGFDTSAGGFVLKQDGINGTMKWFPNADNPQFLFGKTDMSGAGYIDVENGKPLLLQTLESGPVRIGNGGLFAESDGGPDIGESGTRFGTAYAQYLDIENVATFGSNVVCTANVSVTHRVEANVGFVAGTANDEPSHLVEVHTVDANDGIYVRTPDNVTSSYVFLDGVHGTGNAVKFGINPNFIGTTSNSEFYIRTFNANRISIRNNGEMGIGGDYEVGTELKIYQSEIKFDGFSAGVLTLDGSKLLNSGQLDASLVADGSVSDTEFQYLNGVTSAIQTQLDAKAADSAVVHTTGTETVNGSKTFTNKLVSHTVTSTDNFELKKSTSTTHWLINAGRSGFYDNWLLFKNEGEGGSYTFAISDNGAFRGKDGSAGAPTYTFDNASNYGMSYDSGGNEGLVLSTEGIPRLRIEDDGTLSVAGTANYEALVTSDDDIPNKKYVDDSTANFPTTTKGDLIVHNGSSDVRLPAGSNGYVLTANSSATEGVEWAQFGDNIAVVQARRTTGHSITDTWTTITFNTTDIETDATVVEHNNTNTERIDIKITGIYEVYYHVDATADSGNFHDIQTKVLVNGSTLLGGSETSGANYGSSSMIYSPSSRTVVANFNASDYVILQIRYDTAAITGTTKFDPIFMVKKLETMGPQGPPGPAGSGTTLNIEEGGTLVTNTPHTNLDFDGTDFNVADNGDGSCTVSIASVGSVFGSEFHEGSKNTQASTTSTSFQQYYRLTTTSIPAGTYRFAFSATMRQSSTSYDMIVRCQVDDATTIPVNDVGYFQQEIQDSNSDQRCPFGTFGYVTFGSAGTHNIDVDYRSSSSSGTAYIFGCQVEFWRVS